MKKKLLKLWNIIKLNKTKSLSLLRHILTGVGALIVAKGMLDQSVTEEVIGYVMTLIGILWSFNDKTETEE
jgi:hypothetical protein